MATNIVKHVCKDCQHELTAIQQERWSGGYFTLLTCWNPDCLLRGVTLSPDEYNRLNDTEWEQYRMVNRARMAVQHG